MRDESIDRLLLELSVAKSKQGIIPVLLQFTLEHYMARHTVEDRTTGRTIFYGDPLYSVVLDTIHYELRYVKP